MNKENFVIDIRNRLAVDGRSLKWWYENFVTPVLPDLKYSNFIRKMNIRDEMTPELKRVIRFYLVKN